MACEAPCDLGLVMRELNLFVVTVCVLFGCVAKFYFPSRWRGKRMQFGRPTARPFATDEHRWAEIKPNSKATDTAETQRAQRRARERPCPLSVVCCFGFDGAKIWWWPPER